jgi:hypothetical protein
MDRHEIEELGVLFQADNPTTYIAEMMSQIGDGTEG